MKSLAVFFSRLRASALIWIWLFTGLRLINLLLLLPVAIRLLPSEELGLWYTMLGITLFAGAMDLGATTTIGRYVSFFLGGAKRISADGGVERAPGADTNFAGIRALLHLCARIFLGLSLPTLLICVGGGIWLCLRHPELMQLPVNVATYIALSIAAIWRMRESYWNAVLFGLNRIRESQTTQITGLLLNYGIAVGGMLAGGGILALAAGQFAMQIVPCLLSRRTANRFLGEPFASTQLEPDLVPDVRGIWKPSWRIWLINQASWMNTSGTVLLCSQLTSLAETASYSLCMQLALTVYTFAAATLAAKQPLFSVFMAAGRGKELRRMVFSRMAMTFGLFIIGAAIVVLFFPVFMELVRSQTPALPATLFILLFVAVGLELFTGSQSSVLIGLNHSGHWIAYLGSGIATFAFAYFGGLHLGLIAIVCAPILGQMIWNVWAITRRFLACLEEADRGDHEPPRCS